MEQVREIVANKILVGGAGQKVVWERLLGKKGRKQVSKQQQWEPLGGVSKVMGPGKIYGKEMTRKWAEQGRVVVDPFSSLYIWKKTISSIQIMSNKDKIRVSNTMLQ